jgi:hypothetical protein
MYIFSLQFFFHFFKLLKEQQREREEDRQRFVSAGGKANPFFNSRKATESSVAFSAIAERPQSQRVSCEGFEPIIFPKESHVRQEYPPLSLAIYPSIGLRLQLVDRELNIAPLNITPLQQVQNSVLVSDFCVLEELLPHRAVANAEHAVCSASSQVCQVSEAELAIFRTSERTMRILGSVAAWCKERSESLECDVSVLQAHLSRLKFANNWLQLFVDYLQV